MSANTSTLLENFDLKDLLESYKLAYLEKKGFKGKPKDPKNIKQYQHWDLGEFEDGHILRTDDNSLFAFTLCPEMTNRDTDIKRQALSANLQEQFLNMIAHLMAKKHGQLPTDKIKIAFGINHHNSHWTCLLAEFNDLDKKAYRSLYLAHQRHAKQAKNKEQYFTADGTAKPFNIQVNNIKNFLVAKRGIRVNGHDPKNPLGNWQLPLNARFIQLRHFDSMGTKTHWAQNVQASSQGFLRKHRIQFGYETCIQQEGNTCGDWTIFNAFSRGVLNASKKVNSTELRRLSENITVKNAKNILYAKQPRLLQATASNRICVTAQARAIADLHEEAPSLFSTYSLSSTWHQISRVLLGVTIGITCYAGVPVIVPLSLGVKSVVSGIAALAGFACFDKVAPLVYGKHKLKIDLNKRGVPVKSSVEHADGLMTKFGMAKPYLKTLAELEQEITQQLISYTVTKPNSLIATDPQKRAVLVRYYAKKIVTEYSNEFYDEDKEIISSSQYVNENLAKKYLH